MSGCPSGLLDVARTVRDLADRVSGQYVAEEVDREGVAALALLLDEPKLVLGERAERTVLWLLIFVRSGGVDALAADNLFRSNENLRGLIAAVELGAAAA